MPWGSLPALVTAKETRMVASLPFSKRKPFFLVTQPHRNHGWTGYSFRLLFPQNTKKSVCSNEGNRIRLSLTAPELTFLFIPICVPKTFPHPMPLLPPKPAHLRWGNPAGCTECAASGLVQSLCLPSHKALPGPQIFMVLCRSSPKAVICRGWWGRR